MALEYRSVRLVRIPLASVPSMIGVPSNVIADRARIDPFSDTIEVLLSALHFEPVWEGCEPPLWSGVQERLWRDGAHRYRRYEQ